MGDEVLGLEFGRWRRKREREFEVAVGVERESKNEYSRGDEGLEDTDVGCVEDEGCREELEADVEAMVGGIKSLCRGRELKSFCKNAHEKKCKEFRASWMRIYR